VIEWLSLKNGGTHMGLESHILELADKHHKLDEQIHDELHRPLPDDLMISELKKRKLRLKEEIERLKTDVH
jgi:hypothetical protein